MIISPLKSLKELSVSAALETLLQDAINHRASDIHIEPQMKDVLIRYRIDGILNDVAFDVSLILYRQLLSRIKLLSQLKYQMMIHLARMANKNRIPVFMRI